MSEIYNTVDSTKFYNFISNQHPNGVYPGLLSGVSATFLIRDWFTTYALPGSSSYASNNINFYFPSVVSSPTESESCTGAIDTSTNWRWKLGMSTDYTISHNSSSPGKFMNTQNSGLTSVDTTGILYTGHVSGTFSIASVRHVTFGVCTPTSVVLVSFELNDVTNRLLTNFTNVSMYSAGWLHNGAFPSPFTNAAHRYNNCYAMCYRYTGGLGLSAGNVRLPNSTGTTNSVDCREPKYFEVNCLSGSYTPGLFLTDFGVREAASPNTFRGNVDNRIVCIGRGANFVVGNVYRATNVFGRTGNEDWLCIMPFLAIASVTYTVTNWTKGQNHIHSQAWPSDQTDYLLLRIYTEVI
jgi:hypothetical protein